MNTLERSRWRPVVILMLVGVIVAMQIGKVPPALPVFRDEFAIGLAAAGWIASIFNLLGTVLGLPAGIVSDRWGHRRALLASFAALAIGGFIGSVADGYALLLLSRAIEGIGYLGVVVSAPAFIIERVRPRDRDAALGVWTTFLPVGFAPIVIAAPYLMASFGWQGLWLLCAGLMTLGLIVFALGTRDSPDAAASPARRAEPLLAGFRILLQRGPQFLFLILGLFSLQWFGLSAWLPTYLSEEVGFSFAQAALISAAVVFVNAPGSVLGIWMLNRGSRPWQLIAWSSMAMGVLGVVILSELVGADAKLWLALAFSFLGGLLPPAVFAIIPGQASPAQVGAVTGLAIQGNNLGYLVGAPLFGAMVELTGGWQSVGWAILGLGVVATLLGAYFREVRATSAVRADARG